jgi:hypothetical protein
MVIAPWSSLHFVEKWNSPLFLNLPLFIVNGEDAWGEAM